MTPEAETEKVIAVYPTETTVRVGWFKRAPAFLVVHSTGRVSVNYMVEPGVIIEARSVQVSRVLSDFEGASVPLV